MSSFNKQWNLITKFKNKIYNEILVWIDAIIILQKTFLMGLKMFSDKISNEAFFRITVIITYGR